jgi:conjugative transfer relaxase protein TraI
MLSSSTISNVSQASHYFSEKDNYYTQDEGFLHSEWWGKGAADMQLSGQVADLHFSQLLAGRLPNGEQLGKMVDGVIKHRAGWDLTMSAPKSVSIMALVAGDQRLVAAHREAVKVTLEKIQQGCAEARNKVNGEMRYENTHHLTGALYHHDLSRAKDPQLHTHSVIMNLTERTDGKWRSLASSMGRYNEETTSEVHGFIERVRHHNRYYSKLYETELAFRVKACGYELRHDSASGIFEIADVPPALVEQFSKRRQEIEAMLENKGLTGGRAAAVATLSTRNNKEKVDREALKQSWQEEVSSLGVDLNQIKESSIQRQSMQGQSEPEIHVHAAATKIIREATQQMAVFQTNFSLEQLMEYAAREAIAGHCNVQSLLNAIDHDVKQGNLMSLANEQGKTIFMAKSTLDDEKELLSHINNKAEKPLVSPEHLEQVLAQHTEIAEGAHASLLSLFDRDCMVLIEGEANKNALIVPIMRVGASARLEVAILSPSLAGGKKLAKQVQASPQNIWEQVKALFIDTTPKHYSVMQFLSRFSPEQTTQQVPELLIVEQAHLLSTHQKAKLAAWTQQHEAKLLLFGNHQQLLSYQVSTSLQQLSDNGVKTIAAPIKVEKEMVIPSEKTRTTLLQLQQKIVEVTHQDDRHVAMASHYTRLNAEDRASSWIATSAKSNVEKINQIVHDRLVKEGKIHQEIPCEVLTPIFIVAEKATTASSYGVNQVVRFNDQYASLGVQRGDYLRIIRINNQSNRIVLQKEDGSRIVWQPDRVAAGTQGRVEVFEAKSREFGVGDSIVLSRSMKAAGMVKGERCYIEAIHHQRLKLRDQHGKISQIDLAKAHCRHLDYGYAATLHTITHEKPTTLIADLPAQSLSTHQRRLNQILSQSDQVWVYTDDTKKLAATITRQSGNQLSAHDILANASAIKATLHAMYDLLETELSKSNPSQPQEQTRHAIDAMDYALNHLTERQAGFSHKELMQVAMHHALGKVTEQMLADVTLAMEKSNILLRGDRDDGTLWTTAEAIKIEREIIGLTRQDQGKLTAIASDEVISKHLDATALRAEQVDAIKAIVNSTDRVLSIQGRAGTGKTTMMTSLESVLSAKELITESGYTLRGIAPTNKAVKELTSRGIQAQTIDSFLLELQKLDQSSMTSDFSKTVFVLDEASMVSNRKMLEILQVAHQRNFCRLIPTGDIHQNPSIEAGKPHDLMQRSLKKVIHLNDIQRQQNPVLKEAALALYNNNVARTFSLLTPNIIEIPNKDHDEESKKIGYATRVQTLVNDYFGFMAKGQAVQIIAPAHDDRKAINQAVRDQLQAIGTLNGEAHSFSILTSKDMTRAERSNASNFEVGNVVKFVASQSKAIRANDYFCIKGIDKPHNLLILVPFAGEQREILWQIPTSTKQLNHSIEVFKREERQLQVGDKLVWTRTNKKDNVMSAEISEVTQIDNGRVTTKRADQREFVFDAKQPSYQHWDHAYALTTYSTQGGTYDTVLGFFETYRKNLMNLKTFLVTITRVVHELRLYTDNKSKLQQLVTTNHGSKVSSLEVVGDYPSSTSNRPEKQLIPASITPKALASRSPKTVPLKPNRNVYDRLTMDRIIEGVNKDAEKIATHLLGEPKVRGTTFLKFGSHQGSLSVTIKGEHQGWWNDFSEGKGGRSMLSLIQHHGGLTKQEAINFSAEWVGVSGLSIGHLEAATLKNQPAKSLKTHEASLTDQGKKQLAFAKKLASQSKPMEGTLVERYLKEQRGIDLNHQPDDVRYHAAVYSKLNGQTHPAMLVIARNHCGDIKAVQATYLDPTTAAKVDKSKVAIQKQTFGVMKGSTVTILGDKNSPTLIAEGIETGLSLKQAMPHATVKVTLSKSNFVNIDPRTLATKAVLCLDQDGKDFSSDKTILAATKRLIDANKNVFVMVPTSAQKTRQDYNDVLKTQGTHPIKRDYEQAISAQEFFGNSLSQQSSVTIDMKSINTIAKNFAADNQQNNKALVTAYRAMTMESKPKEPINIMPNKYDVERNI